MGKGKFELIEFKEYVCPSCGSVIKHCYSEDYALRENEHSNKVKVCAYCNYEKITKHIYNIAKVLDDNGVRPLNSPQDERKEEVIETIKDKLSNCSVEELDMFIGDFNIRNRSNNLGNEATFTSIVKKEYNSIYRYKNILIAFSENNRVICYCYDVDKDFLLSNGGINPYIEYTLFKEIYNKFNNLKTLKDYYYKLKACTVIGNWEDNEDYFFEFENLKQQAIDDLFMDEGEFYNLYKELDNEDYFQTVFFRNKPFPNKSKEFKIVKEIQDDIKLRFNNKNSILSKIHNEYQLAKRKVLIDEFIIYMNSLHKNIYNFIDGRIYNYDTKFNDFFSDEEYEKYLKLAEQDSKVDNLISNAVDFNYRNEIAKIYIEAWKIHKDPKFLEIALEKQVYYLAWRMFGCFVDSIPGIKSDEYIDNLPKDKTEENIIIYMKYFIENYTSIMEFYREELVDILIDERYKFYNGIGIDNEAIAGGIFQGERDNETTALFCIMYLLEFSVVFNGILNSYIEYLEANNKKELRKKLDELMEYRSKFSYHHEKIIKILYESKKDFEEICKDLNLIEKEFTIAEYNNLIKSILNEFKSLEAEDESIENIIQIMNNKRDAFASIPKNIQNAEVVDLIEELLEVIIKILNKSIQGEFEYTKIFDDLKRNLGERNCNYLGNELLKTLATAEYLFAFFKENSDKINEISDFSCISIMYYKTLEGALNKIIYHPFRDKVNSRIQEFQYNNDINGEKSFKKTFEVLFRQIIRNGYFVDDLTLGNYGKIFSKFSSSAIKEFTDHLISIVKDAGTLEEDIKEFGDAFNVIKDNRNDAAHGGKIIDWVTMEKDKNNIYHIESAENYKRLLLKFLDLLN